MPWGRHRGGRRLRAEFLVERRFASLEEAQAELDGWVTHYNTEHPHQGIGMVAPAKRFALAGEHLAPVVFLAGDGETPEPSARTYTRRVSASGRISFEDHAYHIGVWLAGETVELTCAGGLLEVAHRGVLTAAHARRQPHKAAASLGARPPRPRPTRPQTAGRPVLRKVGSGGAISFAGTTYRVGNAHRCEQVEVRLVGDTVEISQDGRLIKTHAARHDRSKEHGAFSTKSTNSIVKGSRESENSNSRWRRASDSAFRRSTGARRSGSRPPSGDLAHRHVPRRSLREQRRGG